MKANILYTLALIVSSMLVMAVSCEKDKEDAPATKITRFTLMSNYGKAWYIREVKQKYVNASGGVDSTHDTPVSGYTQVMWFGDNDGVNGLHENYYALDPLDRIIPSNGTWALDETRQTITFNCIFSACGTEKNGQWRIASYHQSVYGETLRFERTKTLPAGRKEVQFFELFK